jgi:hypothetical protein
VNCIWGGVVGVTSHKLTGGETRYVLVSFGMGCLGTLTFR